jgi:hypothetical protein
MLSDRGITQDAKENRIRLGGTHSNELQPNGVHDREVCVSPENVRKICMLVYDGIPTLVVDETYNFCR